MPHITDVSLYWRMRAYYLFYFASVGALLPYFGLYLQDRGYSEWAIGQLMAILAGTKIIAPYLLGWIADHGGRRVLMIRVASVAAVLCFCAVYFANGFFYMALVVMLFSFFWNAGLPQFEATTLNFLGDQHHLYSGIRLWGSVGFIATVVLMGPLLDMLGVASLPHVLLMLCVGICLVTFWVPDTDGRTPQPTNRGESIKTVLYRPTVLVVLAASCLMQLSFGAYYTFFSIYLQESGYSKAVTGALWGLGVVAEIVVFLFMVGLLRAFGAKKLILACFLLAALRWFLTGRYVDQLVALLFVQILHAFTFGVFHAVMIHLMHKFFQGIHQGRGQALYSSLSFGLGGAAGSLISGRIWQSAGPQMVFDLAAGMAVLGFVLVLLGMRSESEGSK